MSELFSISLDPLGLTDSHVVDLRLTDAHDGINRLVPGDVRVVRAVSLHSRSPQRDRLIVETAPGYCGQSFTLDAWKKNLPVAVHPRDQAPWRRCWRQFTQLQARWAAAENPQERWQIDPLIRAWEAALRALSTTGLGLGTDYAMSVDARILRKETYQAWLPRFTMPGLTTMALPLADGGYAYPGEVPMDWWPVLADWSDEDLARATALVKTMVAQPSLWQIRLG